MISKLSDYINWRLDQWTFKRATLDIGPERSPSRDGRDLKEVLIELCRALPEPRVLELGARRSIAERSTLHNDWVPHAGEYLGTDIESGADVDFVADVHRLSSVVGEEQFDVVISCSTFEHFKYPHLAAHEVMKVLKVGGLLFIQTHQTYPVHAYPFDYYRFSREALAGLFPGSMGFSVIETDYEFPARIYAPREPRTKDHRCYLNVRLLGKKVSNTPKDYIYEFDVVLGDYRPQP